ncbi:MAG: hypothetical protein H7Y04_16860, partial [Verrucomicrobia bacterium]|nr:hypothetical protein [Cytophagales bacterium]
MKLIEQSILWNNSGTSDKVYEIDLCEVGTNQFVVNFRYGKRNTTLKDGTKTTLPTNQIAAKKVFDDLVSEKKKGGYQVTSHTLGNQTTTATPVAKPPTPKPNYGNVSKREFMLACLREATTSSWNQKKWSLSRIIWRSGELQIKEATPILLQILPKSTGLHLYCICFALGKCAGNQEIEALRQIYQKTDTLPHIKRMAWLGMYELAKNSGERPALASEILNNLPDFVEKIPTPQAKNQNTNTGGFNTFWKKTTRKTDKPEEKSKPQDETVSLFASELLQFIQTENVDLLTELLEKNLGKTFTYSILEPLYWISEEKSFLREIVLHFLRKMPLEPNSFKTIRHIFKAAEFRADAEIFGILAYRFEKTPTNFILHSWTRKHNYGIYLTKGNWEYVDKPMQELKKQDSKLAFSNYTKKYFYARIWRTLRTLGEDGFAENYTKMAAGVLMPYTDSQDKSKVFESTFEWWDWNKQTRRSDKKTRISNYDIYANCINFYHILFENSPRYELKKNNKAWKCKNGFKPGQLYPEVREEAFPELWDKNPQVLFELLAKSEAEPVHDFAVKVLKNRSDLASLANLDFLVEMLQKPFPVTVKFGLQLIKSFYNPAQPNLELLQMLIHHPLEEARNLAKQWITEKAAYFVHETLLIKDLIINPYPDNWDFVRKLLVDFPLSETEKSHFTALCLAELFSLPPENE